MNPSSSIGRFELSDNIKSLFRQIKMVQPDALRIAEVVFELNNFDRPKDTAKKLFIIFNNLENVLDKRKYDFSLRNIKQVM